MIVRVTQYSITLVSSWSRVKAFSGSPSQSLHARNFSTIQASRPAGESLSADAERLRLRSLLERVRRLLALELLERGEIGLFLVGERDRILRAGPRSAC